MNKATILIVDDSSNIRRLLSHTLNKTFNVLVAEDGEKALDLLEEGKKPDLMLIDVAMPRMDGFSLTARLKNHDTYRDIPVIMLTAKDKSSDKIEGMRLGADDYITKPFNLEELKERIEKVLQE